MRIPFTNLHIGGAPEPVGLPASTIDVPMPPVADVKASTVAPLIYLLHQGQTRGAWGQRDPAQYSYEAYQKCAVAYKAICEVSRGAAKIPWRAVRGADAMGEGGTPLPASHPLNVLLRKPNPWSPEASWREAVVAYLMLTGNTYIEGVGPDGAPPRELWSLRPDRTKVVPGQLGPAGYTYEVNGQIKRFDVDPITGAGCLLHLKLFHPLSDWYGLSPIEAAATSVDGFNMAGEWNQSLLQNGCRPSGALVYKPSETQPDTLSDKQRQLLMQQLNTDQSGTRNAGRPLLLEGGLEWQQMSMSPAEMDWLNGKNVNAREVAMIYGVPPQILAIPGDNTYSNYQEARLALYQDTILPMNDSLIDSLNSWLCPAFGDGITIVQDISRLPALAPMREKTWASVAAATWMTINEKRAATGLGKLEQPEADALYIASSMVPLAGSLEEPDGDETLPEHGEPDGDEQPGQGEPDGDEQPGKE